MTPALPIMTVAEAPTPEPPFDDPDHPTAGTARPAGPRADGSGRREGRRALGRTWARRLLVVGCDVTAVVGGVTAASALSAPVPAPAGSRVLYGLTMLVALGALRLYHARWASDRREELARVTRSGAWALAATGLAAMALDVVVDLRAALALFCCTVGAVMVGREALRRWFAHRRRAGDGLWASILVAAPADASRIRAAIEADPTAPHVVLGVVDPNGTSDRDGPRQLLAAALRRAGEVGAQGVVIAESSLDAGTANALVRGLLDARLHVDLSSALSDISIERLTARSIGPGVATRIAPRPRGGWRGRSKRAFDLALAVTALIVLSPVLVAIAAAVRLGSPGPVLFRQERVGRYGEPFHLLKFRSMVADAEALRSQLAGGDDGAGPLFKLRADPRVTTVGRFLRRTSLDELPQLLNVVRNEMSLVGPRPALRAEMAQWDPALHDRLQVKPGITGMWQVSGRSETSFAEYTRLDLYYVHNWSLLVDLSILVRTVPAVLGRNGAY